MITLKGICALTAAKEQRGPQLVTCGHGRPGETPILHAGRTVGHMTRYRTATNGQRWRYTCHYEGADYTGDNYHSRPDALWALNAALANGGGQSSARLGPGELI